MSDQNFLYRIIENSLGQYWLPAFRLELLLFLALAAFYVPEIKKELRGVSRSAGWALAGLLLLYAGLLWLRAGPDFRGFSEEWEELNLAKMVLNGDLGSFKVFFRHGTTWPFLLADWFRLAGARPEMVILLNIVQSLAIPLLLFIASRLLFRSDGAALLSVMLFAAWPETARYTAFTFGKTEFVMFEVAVFIAVFSAAFRFPKPAAILQLFLTADLLAKTRQEFAVLYLAAILLWLWKAPGKSFWLLLPVMLPLVALYYPLFVRGVGCHLIVTHAAGETMVSGAGETFPWLLWAACALIAAALFKNKKMLADKAWRIPALVVLLPDIVYFVHPAGFQNRLAAQTLPALLLLLGWAIWELAAPYRRSWLCAGILPLLLFSWTAGDPLPSGAAEAAMTRFHALRGGAPAMVVFEDLDSYSQWNFLGFEERSFQLPAVVPGWDNNGRHPYLPARRFFGGKTVWLISKLWTQNRKTMEWDILASNCARMTGEYKVGGWHMCSYVFSGEKIDPWLSKTFSDKGVDAWLKGDRPAAARCLKEALALDPDNLDALVSYSTARKLAGDVAGCEKLIKRAVLISNKDRRSALIGNCRGR